MAYIDFDSAADAKLVKELQELRQQTTSPDPMMTEMRDRLTHIAQSGGGFSGRDFERIIGRNDLLAINYLDRGIQAAAAVGRIDVTEEIGGTGNFGTGFLISPSLLMTNHHVIGDKTAAARAVVEFGYERDAKGFFKTSRRFRLDPARAFMTSPQNKLDYTVVAVMEVSEDGAARLEDYGFLRLDPHLNKILVGEFVTIVQHPNGEAKAISIRENKLLQIGGGTAQFKQEFLWYASDTAPGSSGSPAFNDNWQVVAIHHKGIPVTRTTAEGGIEFQRTSEEWVAEEVAQNLPEDSLKWEANEGVRISAIVADIRSQQKQAPTPDAPIVDLLDDIDGIRPIPGRVDRVSIVTPDRIAAATAASGTLEAARRPSRQVHPLEYYDGRQGYDPNFLSVAIPLPTIGANALKFGKVAAVTGNADGELKYEHFSVIFNADRRFAFLTAVNIDGSQSVKLGRDDRWFYDPRISLDLQVDDTLYGNEPVPPKNNYFDRGHLVRRLDPVWGDADTCATANQDTFHWTNCTPQYWEFNQKEILWQGLENFILNNIDGDNLRGSVFTGPIFSEDDEVHRQIKIPQAFWKVVAVVDNTGKLYTSAYVVSQKKYATNIPFERLPVGKFNNFQLPIAELERVIGISFGAKVLAADVISGSTASRPLKSVADITHPRRSPTSDRSGLESLFVAPPVANLPHQGGIGRFGQHESFEAFLEYYTRARSIEDKLQDAAEIGLEARRQKIRKRKERDVVEIAVTVVDYLGLDSKGGDNHQQAFLTVTAVLATDPDIQNDLQRVIDGNEKVFLSIRYGDRMGLANPVPGVADGSALKLRGEWIPKDRAYAHGGEKLSVIHFTHHPIGFVCNAEECWD